MKILYIIIFASILGCSTSTNSDKQEEKIVEQKQELKKEEEHTVEKTDKASKITLDTALLGGWVLLLKQSDTSNFEIINPCNGSAGGIMFSSEVSISSGQEAMGFNLVNFTKGKIEVVGNDKQEHTINFHLTADANYLDIIPEDDFPTSYLFGNFYRASFDSLLANTGTKDTLHFAKYSEMKGINKVDLPCPEGMFD